MTYPTRKDPAMTTERTADPRQPANDAVFAYLRSTPSPPGGPYERAMANARVWRAVEAALDAMGVPKVPASDLYPMASSVRGPAQLGAGRMTGMDDRTFRSGESFTITTRQTIELEEGDMITDPLTGITYYRQDGEIRTVETAKRSDEGHRG